MTKVFYTSFHRNATTSMAYFLRHIGCGRGCDHGVFHPSQPGFISMLENRDYSSMLAAADEYDYFTDSPWFLFYELFDIVYDNAKFIHCIRDPESWYTSCHKYLGGGAAPIEEYIYGRGKGDPIGNKHLWIERFLRHHHDVMRYFNGKDNFLLLDFFGGKNREETICDFLGIQYNGSKFRHINAS